MGSTGGATDLAWVVREQTEACLAVYREDPSRVEQDANNELRIAEGGYRNRQLLELIQNAVDAARAGGGRVEVRLGDDVLYVANDGAPFDEKGIRALMASDLSPKDDDRIGRFGIGFKSVLAISDDPRIHSATVGIDFNAAWSEQTIRNSGFIAPRYPKMRLARALDPRSRTDSHLDQLLTWASTVVVLPVVRHRERLARDIRTFPDEFLLFSPHIREARFLDTAAAPETHDRTVRRKELGGRVLIARGNRERQWQVMRGVHHPSSTARADAGRLSSRDTIALSWAVPCPPTSGVGTFWAFFPTEAQTTLAGIVNAPWKLSDDRTNLLSGAFNRELLAEALPRLLSTHLGDLFDPENPCTHLDALPARGREQRNWADGVVNEPIFEALRRVPSVPDASGALRLPTDVRMLPDDLRSEWVDEWKRSGLVQLQDWAHPDLGQTAERRLKARRLIGADPVNNPTVDEWLESMVGSGTADASASAIRLAAQIVRADGASESTRNAALSARILRLEDGSFVRPVRGRVFVRASEDAQDGAFIDGDLVGIDGVDKALAVLGVTVLDRRGELQRLLVTMARSDSGWDRIWRVARELPDHVVASMMSTELPSPVESSVRVRAADGRWQPLAECLLPGAVIPSDGRRDRDRLIDPRFHAEDMALLRELGAVSEPVWRDASPRERWFAAYEQAMRDNFIKEASSSKPHPDLILVDGPNPPWPLGVAESMSPEGRVELTRFVLGRGTPRPWTVRHRTNGSYGKLRVVAPEVWFLRKHAMVETTFGPLPPRRALIATEDFPDALPLVTSLPTTAATKLGVREHPQEFTRSDWEYLSRVADTWTDDARRVEFYTWLPDDMKPATLVVRVGPRRERVAPENVGVATSRAVYESLVEAHVPAVLVPLADDARRFVDIWGMPDGKNLLRQEVVAEESGEPSYLIDEFPPLKLNPRFELADYELQLQQCSRLQRLVATPGGQVARTIGSLRDGGRILVTASAPAAVLRQVSDALSLEMTEMDIARVLAQMNSARTSQLRVRIRGAAEQGPESALVAAAGADALRTLIPAQALEALEAEQDPDDLALARLALAVHGVSILKQLRPVLEERGLEPPREFAGRQKERRWVGDLALPMEWAGFPARPAPAREAVDGPVALKPLHRYQEVVTERIRALLAGIGRERGVVSLPTGAGKTRVTVQALIEEIAAGRLAGPIVWIAQSEELCAQAAESWAYVWRALGPGHQLILSRLWGANEIEEEPEGTQVVIAIDAKLESILDRQDDRYEWLREPSVVVVDEAHTSVSPRYTKLFDWLGRSGRTRRGDGYILGLTATPFRGRSDEETERLVRRYDSNLLDLGVLGDNPYLELQEMGVLARIERRTVDGVAVEFTDEQRADIEATNRFPSQMADALGRSAERNRRIVEAILALPSDWQVLLFAPSVENSRALAALLAFNGVPAVAVTGTTETTARRHYIDQFRDGQIRVLTNYNVLTQGFDAPAVRAVFVCRPTFSPNVYQQMVGRGLRGPLNGGSQDVMIVDVEDNLSAFGDRLAFRDFERLWRR